MSSKSDKRIQLERENKRLLEEVRRMKDERDRAREAIKRSDALLAHRLTGKPPMDYETELLQAAEHDLPAIAEALLSVHSEIERLERENERMRSVVVEVEVIVWRSEPAMSRIEKIAAATRRAFIPSGEGGR